MAENQHPEKIRIAHLVNPFFAKEGSEFSYVQPITFESMRRAQAAAGPDVEVELLSAQFPEDRSAVPEGFRATPDLDRSARDLVAEGNVPPFPILADLLDRLYQHSDAEYLIFTNVDIALQPDFYKRVAEYIRKGHKALIINRRRIPGHYRKVSELPQMYAEQGKPHPGFDCFVFHRSIYPKFQLDRVCTGIPFIGILFAQNMFCYGENLLLLTDEHMTFHIGEDVFRKRNKLLFAHNRDAFWRAIKEMWPDLDAKKFPWSHLWLPVRLVKWGLHPSIPIRLALKLEWKRLFGKSDQT